MPSRTRNTPTDVAQARTMIRNALERVDKDLEIGYLYGPAYELQDLAEDIMSFAEIEDKKRRGCDK